MGNLASTVLIAHQECFTTSFNQFMDSDKMIDMMESQVSKQVRTQLITVGAQWMTNALRSCKHMLENVFFEATATFSDPSEMLVEAINGWHLPLEPINQWNAFEKDDDCASTTTDVTEDLSEPESHHEENFALSEWEHEWESDDDEEYAPVELDEELFQEDEDCETTADRLIRLASASSTELHAIYLEDYLCMCGECPQYKRIAHDVQKHCTCATSEQKHSVIRMLQAFSTYNEVIGYTADMIATAEECLQLWNGDEDRAFTSLVMLCDEVPHLCAP